jgi:anti-sigma factor RsiW
VTTPWDCAEIRAALGVYVVGAIDPADRATVDSHLAWCTDCREELAGLAALPGRLGSVPHADVTMLVLDEPRRDGPTEAVLPSLLERAAALRRRLRWRRVAAAVAVAVIASGGAVAVSRAVDPAAPRPAALAPPWDMAHGRDPLTGAAATVRYLAQPWGIQMQVQVSQVSPGTRCELLVVGPGGRVAAAGWTVAAGHADAWYPASAPLGVPGVRGFVVASATGKALVSVPVH